MKTVVLDGACLANMAEVHRAFAETLEFPAWYGNNLDALYDMLTERTEELTVVLAHRAELARTLGSRYAALLALLNDASEENPALTVELPCDMQQN